MLSHQSHDILHQPSHQAQPPTREVTVSVKVCAGQTAVVTRSVTPGRKSTEEPLHSEKVNSADMASGSSLLECPMCDFKVLPTDDYILQLHFEQAHTTDSPFIIDDDDEPPPPSLPPRPSSERKHVGDTPSSDEEESTVTCPEPDCGELVLLTDFNDHLDYHAAETLSFDETTGKYHSHHSSATMQGLASHHPHGLSKSQFLDRSFMADLPETLKRNEGHSQAHKSKKHGHRHRSNTNSSEKSTLSRSILTFNPFVKPDKSVKPPNKSARLGVSSTPPVTSLQVLTNYRNLNWALTPGKTACPDGCMTNSPPVQKSLLLTVLGGTAALSSKSRFRTKRRVLYPSWLNSLPLIALSRRPITATRPPFT